VEGSREQVSVMSRKVMCVQDSSTGVLKVSSVVIYRRSSSLHECISTITHCWNKAQIDRRFLLDNDELCTVFSQWPSWLIMEHFRVMQLRGRHPLCLHTRASSFPREIWTESVHNYDKDDLNWNEDERRRKESCEDFDEILVLWLMFHRSLHNFPFFFFQLFKSSSLVFAPIQVVLVTVMHWFCPHFHQIFQFSSTIDLICTIRMTEFKQFIGEQILCNAAYRSFDKDFNCIVHVLSRFVGAWTGQNEDWSRGEERVWTNAVHAPTDFPVTKRAQHNWNPSLIKRAIR